MNNKLKKPIIFFAGIFKTYKEWLKERKLQKYNKFVIKKVNLEYKIKNLDDKLVLYIKKIQIKKQKLQEKLEKINNKLDKLNKTKSVEVSFKKSKNVDSNILSLSSSLKN